MAKLTPSAGGANTYRPEHRRYRIDTQKIVQSWFGGVKNLARLCDVYGVPKVPRPYSVQSAAELAVLLELAERMHKPLDLYQFVTESR